LPCALVAGSTLGVENAPLFGGRDSRDTLP
jgi:hypothetical protein